MSISVWRARTQDVYKRQEQHYGYSWAFAVPGIFMGIATFVFWLGRKKYHRTPPECNNAPYVFWWMPYVNWVRCV